MYPRWPDSARLNMFCKVASACSRAAPFSTRRLAAANWRWPDSAAIKSTTTAASSSPRTRNWRTTEFTEVVRISTEGPHRRGNGLHGDPVAMIPVRGLNDSNSAVTGVAHRKGRPAFAFPALGRALLRQLACASPPRAVDRQRRRHSGHGGRKDYSAPSHPSLASARAWDHADRIEKKRQTRRGRDRGVGVSRGVDASAGVICAKIIVCRAR